MIRVKFRFPFLLLFLFIACNAIGLLQAQAEEQTDFQADEVSIVLRIDVAIETLSERYGTHVLDYIPGTRLYRLGLPPGSDIQGVIAQMRGAGYIESGEPNYISQTPEAKQSTIAFIDQSSMTFIDGSSPPIFFGQPAFTQVHATEAHQLATGRNVVVAVIDTGMVFDHPMLAARIAFPNYDFVTNNDDPAEEPGGLGYGHGTFVSGIIARLAPGTSIMPLRALDRNGRGHAFNIAKAIYFAVDNGARVINMSFGMTQSSEFIARAIGYARNESRDRTRPVVLVASAGNDNRSSPAQFPASDGRVLAVAAVDERDIKAGFSNFGPHVFVSAPGVNVYSTYPRTDEVENDGFAWWSGTSFAAPFVAAQVALLLERFPDLAFGDIRNRMQDQSRLVNIDRLNPGYTGRLGRGRIDLLWGVR